MFCKNCGNKLNDGDIYCSNCGSIVSNNNQNAVSNSANIGNVNNLGGANTTNNITNVNANNSNYTTTSINNNTSQNVTKSSNKVLSFIITYLIMFGIGGAVFCSEVFIKFVLSLCGVSIADFKMPAILGLLRIFVPILLILFGWVPALIISLTRKN